MKRTSGFTLIELLIVIGLLAILIIAILSVIDPVEQIRKSRDAGRKSDASELLTAYERYYSTHFCYPWDIGAPDCTTPNPLPAPVNPDFSSGGNSEDLLVQDEIKPQFPTRRTIRNNELWLSEAADTRLASICFEPESRTGRLGGFGPIRTQNNQYLPPASCNIPPNPSYPDSSCYVCIPQ